MLFSKNGFSIVNISTSTTWDATHPPTTGYNSGITINSNVTLTINNLSLVMNTNSSIYLSNGGKLLLNATTISGTSTTTWKGIIADGSPGEQFQTFPENVNNDPTKWRGVLLSSQTLVELIGSSITDALIGIKSNFGAVVRCRNTNFSECQRSIQLNEYLSTLHPEVNACFFMNCTFNWTGALQFQTDFNLIHIELNSVRGINIGGCSFLNNIGYDPIPCPDNETRGKGIYATYSSLSLAHEGDKLCDDETSCLKDNCKSSGSPKGNTFKYLDYGIRFNGEPESFFNKLAVRYSVFDNCAWGINAQYSNNILISNNEFKNDNATYLTKFKSPKTVCSDFIESISLTCTGGNVVMSNIFNSDMDNIYHIRIYRTDVCDPLPIGSSNIKKNTFYNTFTQVQCPEYRMGIDLHGNNNKTNIVCNTFADLAHDITLEPDATIASIPLKAPLSAENIYSKIPSSGSAGSGCDYNIENLNTSTIVNFYTTAAEWNRVLHLNNYPRSVKQIGTVEQNYCTVKCDDFLTKINYIKKINTKIYPNPTAGKITFEINKDDYYFLNKVNLTIESSEGKQIFSKEILNATTTIDLEKFKFVSGVYFAKLVAKNKNISYQKIIFQN